MKRFIARLLLFAAFQLGVALVLFSTAVETNNRYLAATVDKHRRLMSAPSPKIVFVGGSGLAYGMDSEMVKKESGHNSVNMGMHDGLGLVFKLREIRGRLREGDVAVVSLEYTFFTEDYGVAGRHEGILEVVSAHPSHLVRVDFSPGRIKYFLDHGLSKACMYTRSIVFGMPRYDPPYHRWAYNEFGDVVEHHDMKPNTKRARSQATKFKFHVKMDRIRNIATLLNEFSEYCKRRGVVVVMSYPPIPEIAFEKTSAQIANLDKIFREVLDFPILNSPEDVSFPIGCFFDSMYHLTQQGKNLRTKLLLRDLHRHGVLR